MPDPGWEIVRRVDALDESGAGADARNADHRGASFLGRVIDGGAHPTEALKFILVRPVHVHGPDKEGQAAAGVDEDSPPIAVLPLNEPVPEVGHYVLAVAAPGGRWVCQEYGRHCKGSICASAKVKDCEHRQYPKYMRISATVTLDGDPFGTIPDTGPCLEIDEAGTYVITPIALSGSVPASQTIVVKDPCKAINSTLFAVDNLPTMSLGICIRVAICGTALPTTFTGIRDFTPIDENGVPTNQFTYVNTVAELYHFGPPDSPLFPTVPAVGATVQLLHDGSVVASASTDGDGVACFPPTTLDGLWRVDVTFPGWHHVQFPVLMDPCYRGDISVNLHPDVEHGCCGRKLVPRVVTASGGGLSGVEMNWNYQNYGTITWQGCGEVPVDDNPECVPDSPYGALTTTAWSTAVVISFSCAYDSYGNFSGFHVCCNWGVLVWGDYPNLKRVTGLPSHDCVVFTMPNHCVYWPGLAGGPWFWSSPYFDTCARTCLAAGTCGDYMQGSLVGGVVCTFVPVSEISFEPLSFTADLTGPDISGRSYMCPDGTGRPVSPLTGPVTFTE